MIGWKYNMQIVLLAKFKIIFWIQLCVHVKFGYNRFPVDEPSQPFQPIKELSIEI